MTYAYKRSAVPNIENKPYLAAGLLVFHQEENAEAPVSVVSHTKPKSAGNLKAWTNAIPTT